MLMVVLRWTSSNSRLLSYIRHFYFGNCQNVKGMADFTEKGGEKYILKIQNPVYQIVREEREVIWVQLFKIGDLCLLFSMMSIPMSHSFEGFFNL